MRKFFISLLLVLLLAGGVVAYFGYSMFYNSAVEEVFTVRITPKTTYDAVVEKIKNNSEYDWAFEFYAEYLDLESNLRVGTFRIEPGMSVMTIVRTLKYGDSITTRLTINNARTPEALAKKIAAKFEFSEEDMLSTLRDSTLISELGYNSAEEMFSIFIPNTYEVYPDIEPEALVRKLKDESDKFWAKHTDRVASLGLTPYEIMTLASIVHEETNAVDEMPRIAGVYLNRLWKGMPLQADPTVKYAVGDPTLKRILFRHLEVDSPYNTYKVLGLPPTPIAMPDMAAIEAVLNYEKHDYLYFCARPEMDGRHNFARTHREHERNAAAYHRALERQNIR